MFTKDSESCDLRFNKVMFSKITWAAGITIFSMFFGAGNVYFPLMLGLKTGALVPIALLGLLISGIGFPLLGLFAAVLYKGDCKAFFSRIGVIPGYVMVILIFSLIGPFGGMPRCITFAYEAVQSYFPNLSLFVFSQASAVMVLVCIAKRKFVLSVLGWILSPLLLFCLGVIIVTGIFAPHPPELTGTNGLQVFLGGLSSGYDTMDLLASVFFSVAIWNLLKEKLKIDNPMAQKDKLVPACLSAIMIGGSLLAVVYIGMGWSAAVHIPALEGGSQLRLLPNLAIHVLGAKFAVLANMAIALACLTTVMSLAVTIADVVQCEIRDALQKDLKFNYDVIVLLVVVMTAIMSNLGFQSIMGIIHPVMALCYPAIIVLTICNVLYKMLGFTYVKLPFYVTLGITALMQMVW